MKVSTSLRPILPQPHAEAVGVNAPWVSDRSAIDRKRFRLREGGSRLTFVCDPDLSRTGKGLASPTP
jgi:hypothetical protein